VREFDRDIMVMIRYETISIEFGVNKVLYEKKHLTPDLGGISTTEDMGRAICDAIKNI